MADPRRSRRRVAVVVVCAAVTVALAALARLSSPTEIETSAWRWVNAWPDLPARPLWIIMQIGSLVGGMLAGMLVMGLLRGTRGAAAAVTAVVSAWVVAKGVKAVVDRGRPVDYVPSVNTRFEEVLSGGGYVSGHAAIAFALAAVIAGIVRGWWRIVPYAVACVVAIGRLYFGAHLPLDVVGGATLGVAIGVIVHRAFAIDTIRAPGERGAREVGVVDR